MTMLSSFQSSIGSSIVGKCIIFQLDDAFNPNRTILNHIEDGYASGIQYSETSHYDIKYLSLFPKLVPNTKNSKFYLGIDVKLTDLPSTLHIFDSIPELFNFRRTFLPLMQYRINHFLAKPQQDIIESNIAYSLSVCFPLVPRSDFIPFISIIPIMTKFLYNNPEVYQLAKQSFSTRNIISNIEFDYMFNM